MKNEDREVLAHVVIDPDEWYANAVAALGEKGAAEALAKKVERWRPQYDELKVKPGYLPRAQRPNFEPAPPLLG
jgi:hypothetical protein